MPYAGMFAQRNSRGIREPAFLFLQRVTLSISIRKQHLIGVLGILQMFCCSEHSFESKLFSMPFPILMNILD